MRLSPRAISIGRHAAGGVLVSRPEWAVFDINVYMMYDPARVLGGILLKLYQVILPVTAVERLEV